MIMPLYVVARREGFQEMVQAIILADGFEEYTAVAEQFNRTIGALRSPETRKLQHGDVEKLIAENGNELCRLLLQSHFDSLEQEEQFRDAVKGADGLERNHRKDGCGRDLMSVFGKVAVKRIGYGKYGSQNLFPLDARLNLPPNKYSHGLQRLVAEESAKVSFDEVVSSVCRTTGGKVPKRQAEEIVVGVAQDFEAFYESRRMEAAEPTKDPLILSLDGKGIVMRQEGLREATKKAAENEQHKLKTRLSRGEKRNRKRMATVAAVYSIEQYIRSAEAIMKVDEDTSAKTRPRARNKRVWASVSREAEQVADELFQEALRRDPKQRRQWAILIDGQPKQLQNILKSAEAYNAKRTVLILDFIHVLEYLWKAAYAFHSEGSEDAEEWVQQRALLILKGKSSDVAAGMRRSATLRDLTDRERAPVDTCADYLLKYRELIRYDEFLRQGLPIATGVIEGACRHLIKDRMDITGARWMVERAEAILKLRSLRSSGDLEEYLEFHKAQELKRNHLARFDHSESIP
jgi:hypothetical protein